MKVSTFKALLATLQPGQKIRVSGCMYDTRVTPIAVIGTDLVTKGTVDAPTELLDIEGIMRCGASPMPQIEMLTPANDAEAEIAEIEGGQE